MINDINDKYNERALFNLAHSNIYISKSYNEHEENIKKVKKLEHTHNLKLKTQAPILMMNNNILTKIENCQKNAYLVPLTVILVTFNIFMHTKQEYESFSKKQMTMSIISCIISLSLIIYNIYDHYYKIRVEAQINKEFNILYNTNIDNMTDFKAGIVTDMNDLKIYLEKKHKEDYEYIIDMNNNLASLNKSMKNTSDCLANVKECLDKLEKGQDKLEKGQDKLEKGQDKLQKGLDKLHNTQIDFMHKFNKFVNSFEHK